VLLLHQPSCDLFAGAAQVAQQLWAGADPLQAAGPAPRFPSPAPLPAPAPAPEGDPHPASPRRAPGTGQGAFPYPPAHPSSPSLRQRPADGCYPGRAAARRPHSSPAREPLLPRRSDATSRIHPSPSPAARSRSRALPEAARFLAAGLCPAPAPPTLNRLTRKAGKKEH